MSMGWEKFYEECLKYDCRHCGQKRGDPCRDTNLRKAKPHSARQEAVRLARWEWEREKTAPCPTCDGKGRVPMVGPDKTRLLERVASDRLIPGGRKAVDSEPAK